MSPDHARRPIRVTQVPPTSPAMPPSGAAEREAAWRSAQVRMSAVNAAAVTFTNTRLALDTSLLGLAADIEHYILTGETEEPQT